MSSFFKSQNGKLYDVIKYSSKKKTFELIFHTNKLRSTGNTNRQSGSGATAARRFSDIALTKTHPILTKQAKYSGLEVSALPLDFAIRARFPGIARDSPYQLTLSGSIHYHQSVRKRLDGWKDWEEPFLDHMARQLSISEHIVMTYTHLTGVLRHPTIETDIDHIVFSQKNSK